MTSASSSASVAPNGVVVPATKAARHQLIAETLARHAVSSQTVLAELLAERGVTVSQGTLSRDLDELGAVRIRTGEGLVYALPGEGGDRTPKAAEPVGAAYDRLARIAGETLVGAAASANVVVLRTPPGAAQYLASAVDHSELPAVLGCVAGDDTVLVVSVDPDGGQALAHAFLTMAGAVPAATDPPSRSPEETPS